MDFIDDFQSLESISSGCSPQKTLGKNIREYPTPPPPKSSAAFESTFALPLTSTIKSNSSSPGDYYSHGGISSHFRNHTGVVYGTSALTTTTTPTLVTWEPPLSAEHYISDEALERRLKRAQRHWKRQRLRWCVISTRHICIRRLGGRVRARTAWETHVKHICRRAIRTWRSHGVLTVTVFGSVTSADDHYRLNCLKLGLSALKRRFGMLLTFREARTVGEQHWRNRRVAQALLRWDRALEISSILINRSKVADDHYSRRWVMIEGGGPLDEEDCHVEKMGEFHRVRDLNFSSFSLNDGGGIEDVTHRDGPHPTRLHSSRVIFDNENGGIGNNLSSNSPFAAFRSMPSEYSHVQRKQWTRSLESPFVQYKPCAACRGGGGDYYSPRDTSLSLSLQHGRHHGSHIHRRFLNDQETHNHHASRSDNGGGVELVASSVLYSTAAYPGESEVDDVYHEEPTEEEEHNNTEVFGTAAPNSVLNGTMQQQDNPVDPSNLDCNNDIETASFSLNRNARTHFPIGGCEAKAVPEYTEFNGGDVRSVSSFGLQWDVSDSKLPSCIDTASFVSSRDVEISSTIDSSKAQQVVTDGGDDPYSRWRLQNSPGTSNNFIEVNAAAVRHNRSSSRLHGRQQSYYYSNYERAKRLKLQNRLAYLIEQLAVSRSLSMQSYSNYEKAKWLRLRNSLKIFVGKLAASRSLRLQSYLNYERSKRLRFRNGLEYFVQQTVLRRNIRLRMYSNYEMAKRVNFQNSFDDFQGRIATKRSLRLKRYCDYKRAERVYLWKGFQKWLAFQKWICRHAHQSGIENVSCIVVAETMLFLRKGLRLWLSHHRRLYAITGYIRKAEKRTTIMITQRTLKLWWTLSHEANAIHKTLSVADHFIVVVLKKRGLTHMQMNARASRILSVIIAKHQLSMVYRSACYTLRWWKRHLTMIRYVAQRVCRNRKRRCIFKWRLFVTQRIAEKTAFNEAQFRKVFNCWQQRCRRKRMLLLARSHFSNLTRKKTIVYWVDAHCMRLVVARALPMFQEWLVMRAFQVWLSQARSCHQNCNRLRIYKGEKHCQTARSRKGLKVLRHEVFVSEACRTILMRRYLMTWWSIYCKKKRNIYEKGIADDHHRILRLKSVVSTFLHRKRCVVESKSSIARAKRHFYWYSVAKGIKSFLLHWFRHLRILSVIGSLRDQSLKKKVLRLWSARSHYLRESKGGTFESTLRKEGKLLTTLCRFLENASSKRQHTAHTVIALNNFTSRKLHKVLQQWQFHNCQTRAMKNLYSEVVDTSSKYGGTFTFDITMLTKQIPTAILHDLRFINFQTRVLQYSTTEAEKILTWWKSWAINRYIQCVRRRLGVLHYRKSALCNALKCWKKRQAKLPPQSSKSKYRNSS